MLKKKIKKMQIIKKKYIPLQNKKMLKNKEND